MQIEGNISINKDKPAIWNFVSVPDRIVTCLPGLQESSIEGNTIKAKIKAGIGLIRGSFNVTVIIEENDTVNYHARLSLAGSGASSSFNADVIIDLKDGADGLPALVYSSDAKIGGPLGSMASPILKGAVQKMVGQIFTCVNEKLKA
ncbi:MAG: hypothetical protein JRN22_04025 [Nitrososphaerota archaeon]|nr:hypothetical protein [Nitrososphaerota archaeon]